MFILSLLSEELVRVNSGGRETGWEEIAPGEAICKNDLDLGDIKRDEENNSRVIRKLGSTGRGTRLNAVTGGEYRKQRLCWGYCLDNSVADIPFTLTGTTGGRAHFGESGSGK